MLVGRWVAQRESACERGDSRKRKPCVVYVRTLHAELQADPGWCCVGALCPCGDKSCVLSSCKPREE